MYISIFSSEIDTDYNLISNKQEVVKEAMKHTDPITLSCCCTR